MDFSCKCEGPRTVLRNRKEKGVEMERCKKSSVAWAARRIFCSGVLEYRFF